MKCNSKKNMNRRRKIYKKKSRKNTKKSIRNIKKKPRKNKYKRRTRRYKQKGGFANLTEAFAPPDNYDLGQSSITVNNSGYGFGLNNVDTNGCLRNVRYPITKYNSCGNTD